MTGLQPQLTFDPDHSPTLLQQFEAWKDTAGGGHVMRDLYRMAASYHNRYARTGQRVSIRLLWERERDTVSEVRRRLKRQGKDLDKWGGYRLNDHMHSFAAAHIIAHRPDWSGLFEHREKGKPRKVISEKVIRIRKFAS